MGSLPRFFPDECVRCDRFLVEPCYPRVYLCSECEVVCRSPFLFALLRQRLGREPDAGMVATIVGFLAACIFRRRRLHFLHNVLTSRGSCFLQFTYFVGGRSGNISATEDILDRIMSFV